MRLLLVDDHAVVRRGIKALITVHLPSSEVLEAGTAQEAMAALVDPFDLVILDLSMPGRSGLDLLVDIKRHTPALPVLIMSSHAETQFGVRTLSAGAAGYLTKTASAEDLIAAIIKTAKGGRYISPSLAEHLADQLSGDSAASPHNLLSPRELEVLRGVATGQTVKEIAERLHLSVKTVSTYRARLLEKMGMTSNAELTRYAITHGLA